MKKLLALFICLICVVTIHPDGFIAGTLVKTRAGYQAIEDLACGHYIVCFDCAHRNIIEEKITWLHQTTVTTSIRLISNDSSIEMASDQLLYIPSQQQWCVAEMLLQDTHLAQTFCTDYGIDEVREVHEEKTVYTITVPTHHNFFVTKHNILVHNFAIPVLVVGASILEAVLVQAARVACVVTGVAATKYIVEQIYGPQEHKDRSRPEPIRICPHPLNPDNPENWITITGDEDIELAIARKRDEMSRRQPHSRPVPKPNVKPEDPKKPKGPPSDPKRPQGDEGIDGGDILSLIWDLYDTLRLLYEDAPYHGTKGNSIKSKRPIDGPAALINSLPIFDENGKFTGSRIGHSCGEWVMLRQQDRILTMVMWYHGRK